MTLTKEQIKRDNLAFFMVAIGLVVSSFSFMFAVTSEHSMKLVIVGIIGLLVIIVGALIEP